MSTCLSRCTVMALALAMWLVGFPVTAQERPDGRAPKTGLAHVFDRQLQRFQSGQFDSLDAANLQQELDQLRASLPTGDTLRELDFRAVQCAHTLRQDPVAALKVVEQALLRARRVDAAEIQVRLLLCAGLARGISQTPADALTDFDQAISLARAAGLQAALGDSLAQRGSLHSLQGEQAHALLDFLAAQNHYRIAGKNALAEANLINIATVYRRMGEYAKAGEYLRQTREAALRGGKWTELFTALMQLGFLHDDTHQPQQAEQTFTQALEIASERTGMRQDQGFARIGLATAMINQQRYREGLVVLDQAVADLTSIDDTSSAGDLQLLRGIAVAGMGNHYRALEHYGQALAELQRSGNQRYLARLYRARADSHEALGNDAGALADYKQYTALRETLTENMRSEQTAVLRQQFDASRRDMENRRLLADQQAREQQLQALMRMRHWQWVAIGLAGLLLAVLGALAARQLGRLRRLRVLAMTDPLTGVANRRRVERMGNEAIAHARERSRPLCVLSLDVDHFKKVNDGFGHAVGDEVLVRVAKTCASALRQFDLLGRVGGEEFLVVLPDTRLEQAVEVAERLRQGVESLRFQEPATELRASISLGLTALRDEDHDLAALAQRADVALYRAKAGGRNRTEVEP